MKSVTTVSPEALSPGGTRSEATADVEDLLYIVNFENEAGYALSLIHIYSLVSGVTEPVVENL